MNWPDDFINKIVYGNVVDILPLIPDESINCVVTSPPYWGLRDYGVDNQIGLEKTPEEYVEKMTEIFREISRCLTKDGTVWLNLGDSYCASPPGNKPSWSTSGLHGAATSEKYQDTLNQSVQKVSKKDYGGLKPKDLIGIPWRVAFALQSDGWYLRSAIVWSKPNPMPESVTDRPTSAYEFIFLLTKSGKYYYDADAVREPHSTRVAPPRDRSKENSNAGWHGGDRFSPGERTFYSQIGRNKRNVWEIPTQPYPEAHFAVFPEEIPRLCISAGCPENICISCNSPRERIVEDGDVIESRNPEHGKRKQFDGQSGLRDGYVRKSKITRGWTKCDCNAEFRNGIVLDPFMGSGTTGLVSKKLGRRFVGIELNRAYIDMADKRIALQPERLL